MSETELTGGCMDRIGQAEAQKSAAWRATMMGCQAVVRSGRADAVHESVHARAELIDLTFAKTALLQAA